MRSLELLTSGSAQILLSSFLTWLRLEERLEQGIVCWRVWVEEWSCGV